MYQRDTMETQTEADRITMLLLSMTTPELVESKAVMFERREGTRIISLRRILADKIELVGQILQQRSEVA